MAERFRTWLYAPGDRPDRCQKAMASLADQVIWDLEDAVSPEHKVRARDAVIKLLRDRHPRRAWVRVNALNTEWGRDDLEELARIMGPDLRVVLPKATYEAGEEIYRRGYGGEWLFIIETAQGLADVMEVKQPWPCDRGRVRFAFGALDYRNDIGALETEDEWELAFPRSLLAVDSRAWGWHGPIDAVFPGISNDEAVRAAARRARALGMAGKMIIHPQQISPVHQAYRPTTEEVGWAHDVVNASQQAGAVKVRGSMVDRPVLERARQILDESEEGGP